MTIEWTNEDKTDAHLQGWGVFYNSGGADCWEGDQIERIDETEIFPTDRDAIIFVTHNAEAGCRLARKAIAYIKQEGGRIYR